MKECVGMLLAGGEGKRLGALTNATAKPAVPFGGKYRIIDFTLSNCANSNISTLGVLTQYSPLTLNKHIGNGKPWDMNRRNEGLTVLSPYTAQEGGEWYSGTANAIYQHIHFIDQYNPKYILVVSGDHIYQMDYREPLKQHKQTNADVTISVIQVPWPDASRFGILNTTENQRVYEFEEKPEVPESNLASMGIYIFTWKTLRKYLIEDQRNALSSHDFGKDIIPAMLRADKRLFAYRFDGYWKDVGTVQSYWEANMDLLDESWEQFLNNKDWRIHTEDSNFPPQFIGKDAKINHAMINSGCFVHGEVDHSLLFKNVKVEKGCTIHHAILQPGAKVGRNSHLRRVIVIENTVIPDGTVIQAPENGEIMVINQDVINEMLIKEGNVSWKQ